MADRKKRKDLNEIGEAFSDMAKNADPMFSDMDTLQDMVSQLSNGFMGLNEDDVHRIGLKIAQFRKDLDGSVAKLKGDLHKFVEGLSQLRLTLDFTSNMKELNTVLSDYLSDISKAVNSKILETTAQMDKMSKYYQKTATIGGKTARIKDLSPGALNRKIAGSKQSIKHTPYFVDKAGTVYGPLSKTIGDPGIRNVAIRRMRSAPIDHYTGPASTTFLHHNAVENQRVGNVIHSNRVGLAAYSLLNRGAIPSSMQDKVGTTFTFDANDYLKGARLTDKQKEAIMLMALIHDAEKTKKGSMGPLGTGGGEYEKLHDSLAIKNMPKEDRRKLYDYFGKEIYRQMYQTFINRDQMYLPDGSIDPKVAKRLENNPLAWALGKADSKAAKTPNYLNALSSLQMRVSGGLKDTKRLEELIAGVGKGPSGDKEFDAITNMLIAENRRSAAQRLKSGVVDPIDVLTAFGGRIYDSRAKAKMSPINMLDHLSNMVTENGLLKISEEGYIDRQLLKTHIIEPGALNAVIDSVSQNTTMQTSEKELIVKNLSILKEELDKARLKVIDLAGGTRTDPRNVIEFLDKMNLNDLTSSVRIAENEDLSKRAIEASRKRREISDMEYESIKMSKEAIEIEERYNKLEFEEKNKELVEKAKVARLKRQVEGRATASPESQALKEMKDKLAIEELNRMKSAGTLSDYMGLKTSSEMAGYRTKIMEAEVQEILGPKFLAKHAKNQDKAIQIENKYNEQTLATRVEMLGYQKDSLKIQNETKAILATDQDYVKQLAELRKLTVQKQIQELSDKNAPELRRKKAELELAEINEKLALMKTDEYKQNLFLSNQLQLEKTRQELITRGYKEVDIDGMKTLVPDARGVESYQAFQANKLAFDKTMAEINAQTKDQQAEIRKRRLAEQSSEDYWRLREMTQQKRLRQLEMGGTFGGGGGGGYYMGGGGRYSQGPMSFRGMMYQGMNMARGIFGPMLGISSSVALLKQSYEAIRQNELALINLRRVFDGTEEDFNSLARSMSKTAIEFGDTLSGVGKIQEAWAKTGKDTFLEIQELTRVTELAINTAGIEDSETAVRYLNSSLQQMNLNWTEAEALLDSWNKTADEYPSDTKDYAEAYQRSASYAKNLGMDFHDLNAIISMLIESTGRSGDEVGTALRMMFSNLYRPKTQKILKEFGMSLYQIGDQGQELTDRYKPFNQILGEMSVKFQQFNRVGSNAKALKLAEGLGEARRRNFAIALLENWQKFGDIREQSVLGTMEHYSLKKNELTMQSLTKQSQQFLAVMQELSVELGEAGFLTFIKGLLTNGREMVEVFNNMNPAVQDLIIAFVALQPLTMALSKGLQIMTGSDVSGLVRFGESITKMVGGKGLYDTVRTQLESIESLKTYFDTLTNGSDEYAKFIDKVMEEHGLRKAITTATITETTVTDIDTASKIANAAATNSLVSAKRALSLSALGVVAAIGLVVYAVSTYKRHQKELIEREIEEAKTLKSKVIELKSVEAEYNKLSAAGEDLTAIQVRMAEILPEATTGFNAQGQAVAENIELFKKLSEVEMEELKTRTLALKERYEVEAPDIEGRIKALKSQREVLLNKLDQIQNLTPDELKAFTKPGKGKRSVIKNADLAMKDILDQITELNEKIDEEVGRLKPLEAAKDMWDSLFVGMEPSDDKTESIKSKLEGLIADFESIMVQAGEVAEDQSETVQKSLSKIAKAVGSSTVNALKKAGKMTTPVQAAVDYLKATIPGLTELESMSIDKITEAVTKNSDVIRSNQEALYKAASENREAYISEARAALASVQAQIKARMALLGLAHSGLVRPEEVIAAEDTQTRKTLMEQINQYKSEETTLQQLLFKLNQISEEAAKAFLDSEQDFSTTTDEKYKELDKRLDAYDDKVEEITNSISILDAQYSKDQENVEYLTEKNKLLLDSYNALDEYIKNLTKEKNRLGSGDAEKIQEISNKISEATKNMIEAKNQLGDVEKVTYETAIRDYENEIDHLNKLKEINAGGLIANKSWERAKIELELYNSVSSITRKELELTRLELDRVNNKIRENKDSLKDASSETQNQIEAEVSSLKKYSQDLESIIDDQKIKILGLKNGFEDFVKGVLEDSYRKAQEDELDRIDDLIKKETERHEKYVKDLEAELELMERKWDTEDYEKEIEDLEKEIAELREDYNRYAVDDSQWAAKKRMEIQEQLDEKLAEKAERERERERELDRQEIQDRIDDENEVHENFMKNQEKEREIIEDKYKTLLEQIDGFAKGVVDMYESTGFSILKFLEEQVPEYKKFAEDMLAPYVDAQRKIMEFMGLGGVEPSSHFRSSSSSSHQYGMSDADYQEFLENGNKWYALNEQLQKTTDPRERERILSQMRALAARNDYFRNEVYHMPAGSYPSFKDGGVVGEDGLILAHKREMVLPEKYTDVMDMWAKMLYIPRMSIPDLTNSNISNDIDIDSVIKIDHAEFHSGVDYNLLEAQGGIALKRQLFKQGIKITK